METEQYRKVDDNLELIMSLSSLHKAGFRVDREAK